MGFHFTLCIWCLLVGYVSSQDNTASLRHRVLSEEPDAFSCEFPNVQEKFVPATFTSSYPGSGAKMTWKLIRAITGIYTGDDHDHNGRVASGMAVAVKTHFPSHTPADVFFTESLGRIQHAVLLIRNPLSAIPSFHNFVYEQVNGLRNHSTRAPVEAWVAWRNHFFEQEVDQWSDHIRYWVQHFHTDDGKLHLMPYEYLINPRVGSTTLSQLGEFLGSVHPDIQKSLVPPDRYECIWQMFVAGQVPGEKERRGSHRTGGPSGDYPYTNVQLEYAIQSVIRLRDEQKESFPELYQFLQEYLGIMVGRKQQVEGMTESG